MSNRNLKEILNISAVMHAKWTQGLTFLLRLADIILFLPLNNSVTLCIEQVRVNEP